MLEIKNAIKRLWWYIWEWFGKITGTIYDYIMPFQEKEGWAWGDEEG